MRLFGPVPSVTILFLKTSDHLPIVWFYNMYVRKSTYIGGKEDQGNALQDSSGVSAVCFITILLPEGKTFPTLRPDPPGTESLFFGNAASGRLPFPQSLSYSKQPILRHPIAKRPDVVISRRPSPGLFSLAYPQSGPHAG